MGAQGLQELNESSEVRCTGWDRDVMGSSSQRAQNCACSAGNSSHRSGRCDSWSHFRGKTIKALVV